MWFLIKTGILVWLITSVIGRALDHEENAEVYSETHEEPTENTCNCEWRYYKHYEVKGCQVVQVDSCGCPKKYICPLPTVPSEDQKICIYRDQEYKVGSRINITDKCQSCRCLGEPPQITCRQKECPQLESIEDQNCHLVYENDKCCPSKYECVVNSNENEATAEGSFCMYDGITYPLGAKIYPPDDPCLICRCTESWAGVDNSSCSQQDCLFERNQNLLDNDCVPVYHENKCCPIEFYCPENVYLNPATAENVLVEDSSQNHSHSCMFAGTSYGFGMELSMKNPCIKCTCLVPPVFSCIHESCATLAFKENCEIFHSSNHCCPSYECSLNDGVIDEDGSMDTNSSEVICPTPLCADSSCRIEIPEGHQCPTCICNETTSHEKNIFEPIDELMEGPIKNGSIAENTEDFEGETETFEGEVLIPIESDFVGQNRNISEKFIENSSEKEHLEYEEIDDLEQEIETTQSIFEKGSEELENSEKSPDTEPRFLDVESSYNSNSSFSKKEEGFIKILRKRSSNVGNGLNQPQQNAVQSNQYHQSQQQFFEEEVDEREREEESEEGFDELKFSSLSRNAEEKDIRRLDEEELISSESIIVPDGCPTPLCANASCKIEIPVGQKCPTCICKSRENWMP